MEKKQKIILISLLSVLAIIVLLIILNISKNIPKKVVPIDDANKKTEEIISKPITQIQNERSQMINTARGFVELYGTYTNTNDFSNIKDLYPFMTEKLVAKFEGVIAGYKRSDNFYSKTTQVLSTNLPSYKNGDVKASATVSVVEKIIDSTYKENINKKIYTVSLIKDEDKWKVDEIK